MVGEDTQRSICPFTSRCQPSAEVHIGNLLKLKIQVLDSVLKPITLLGLGDAKQVQTLVPAPLPAIMMLNKFKTIIGDSAFIGSNSSLVAPVSIGNGATVGAGSVITRDVAENSLAFERSKQVAKETINAPKT